MWATDFMRISIILLITVKFATYIMRNKYYTALYEISMQTALTLEYNVLKHSLARQTRIGGIRYR